MNDNGIANVLKRYKSSSCTLALCLLLFVLSNTPSVVAQKIIRVKDEPVLVFRFGIGGQQLFGNGPTGGSASFSCEDPISKHLSWTANVVAMMNPIDLALPIDTRSSYQVRFIIQPDFRYYPTAVLHGLYIGGGLGIVAGYGKTIGAYPNGNTQLNIFGEALADLKIGWQGTFFHRYVWNPFAASGFLFPLNGEKKIPILRLGIQLGIFRK